MNPQFIRFSKFLSRVLRRRPQRYGVTLDQHGWAQIDDLIVSANRAGLALTYPIIQHIVAQDDKQRFAIRMVEARKGSKLRSN